MQSHVQVMCRRGVGLNPQKVFKEERLYYSTYFGCSLHPSSGVHKTVDAITGTSHVSAWCRFKSVEGVQGRAPLLLSFIAVLILGFLFIIHFEITLHISGALCTYHQEYIKLQMQSQVPVMCRRGVDLNPQKVFKEGRLYYCPLLQY